ncbi:hypothetical protein [Flagellimonas sp. S3867]|uniref:hypothetical protein n=1 Tax=Flagellimonas sp. S3867 TaxID=2768063 RepID=UPI001687ED3C|nr:hypothetical protein [Flagellimonas sp. S3867]
MIDSLSKIDWLKIYVNNGKFSEICCAIFHENILISNYHFEGITFWDFSIPTEPVLISEIRDQQDFGYVTDMKMFGEQILLYGKGDEKGFFYQYDISDPKTPKLRLHIKHDRRITSVHPLDKGRYILSDSKYLFLVDEQKNIQKLSVNKKFSEFMDMSLIGDKLFVLTYNPMFEESLFSIYTLDNKSGITLIAEHKILNASNINWVIPGEIMLLQSSNCIALYDVHNPNTLEGQSTLTFDNAQFGNNIILQDKEILTITDQRVALTIKIAENQELILVKKQALFPPKSPNSEEGIYFLETEKPPTSNDCVDAPILYNFLLNENLFVFTSANLSIYKPSELN